MMVYSIVIAELGSFEASSEFKFTSDCGDFVEVGMDVGQMTQKAINSTIY